MTWYPTWDAVVREVLRLKAHQELAITKDGLPTPVRAGFYLSTGLPKAQLFDYRLALRDRRGIHIREYADRYTVHWDHIDPSVDFLGHMVVDAPGALWAGLAVVGIGVGMWAKGRGAPVLR
jgi:hypothetical protein